MQPGQNDSNRKFQYDTIRQINERCVVTVHQGVIVTKIEFDTLTLSLKGEATVLCPLAGESQREGGIKALC